MVETDPLVLKQLAEHDVRLDHMDKQLDKRLESIDQKQEQIFSLLSARQEDFHTYKTSLMDELNSRFVNEDQLQVAEGKADLEQEKALTGLHLTVDRRIDNLASKVHRNQDRMNKVVYIGTGVMLALNGIAWIHKFGIF